MNGKLFRNILRLTKWEHIVTAWVERGPIQSPPMLRLLVSDGAKLRIAYITPLALEEFPEIWALMDINEVATAKLLSHVRAYSEPPAPKRKRQK